MQDKQDEQAPVIFESPNTRALQDKTGGGRGLGMDGKVLARAEAVVEKMSDEFCAMVSDDVDALAEAVEACRGGQNITMNVLFSHAFDVKCNGGSFGYPLLSQFGDILCRLFQQREALSARDHKIIDAHLGGMRAVLAKNVKNESHPLAKEIIAGLNRLVAAMPD